MFDIFLANTYNYAHLLQFFSHSFVLSIHIPHQTMYILLVFLAFVLKQVKLELTCEKLFFVIVLILRVYSKRSDTIDEVMGMIVDFPY